MERSSTVVTIADIAEKLGVSKSTVSRAINCKGRIGADTRRKILEIAESCNYIPNSMAKGLVLRRTFNMGVVIPRDADKGDIPFFQNCLVGLSETAYKLDYDVVLVVQSGNDITPLRRLVTNRKVDGVILTRLEENDESVRFLKKEGVPFLVFGTSDDDDLYQIDSDQVSGCFEMTRFMIGKGCRRVAVLGGNKNYRVNAFRYKGFKDACMASGIPLEECTVVWGMDSQKVLDETLPGLMKENPQCLVCMDDAICVYVLKWLKQNEYEVPADIQVISFYDNQILENNTPPVTALNVNAANFASVAGKVMAGLIEGREVSKRTSVGYELKIRESFR